jgi:hypothetical protein
MNLHRWHRGLAAAVIVSALACSACDSGDGTDGENAKEPDQGRTPARQARLFSPKSFWNAELPDDAPIDARSSALVDTIVDEAKREVQRGNGPWLETSKYTTPLYVVGDDAPTVKVALSNPDEDWRRPLQAAFEEVPIPSEARPASGTDGHLTIWQPSTDRLWEFWKARRDSSGWHAEWGGAMEQVSRSPGYFTSRSWTGSTPTWGATATSLPVIGGTILLKELKRGRIDHALAISIPSPKAKDYSWPAQRTDGFSHDPNAIPEGARFRLDPRLDLDSLDLPPLVKMMAEAAQRYGLVVRDKSGGAIGFFAEDWRPSGRNPWLTKDGKPKPDGYLGGTWPSPLLAKFPWNRLQLLKMRLCGSESGGPCPWRR